MYFFSTMALDSVFESLLSILPSCRLSLVCGVYETVGCPIFNFQKGAHNLPSLRISSSQRDYQTIYGEFATKFWTCRRAVFWGKAYNSLVHFSNKPNAVILKSLVSLVRVFSVCVCMLPHSIEYIHFACIYDTCCTFSSCTTSNLCPSWLRATSRSVLASWPLHVVVPQTR